MARHIWIRDDILEHSKTVGLSAEATLLYIACLCYAKEHATFGVLVGGSMRIVAAIADVDSAAVRELTESGLLFQEQEDWYRITEQPFFSWKEEMP